MRSPWLALFLAIIHGLSGLAILLIASWFIAACAVAGMGFNYVLPAVAIRGLALLRISSGYGEMWLSHQQLLAKLAKLRLTLFQNLENQTDNLRATETDKLSYQSQDIASIWVGWVHQNATALLAMFAMSVFVFFALPVFSFEWFVFMGWSLIIYAWLMLSEVKRAQRKILRRAEFEFKMEHHIETAPIWHMMPTYQYPKCHSIYDAEKQDKQRIEWAFSLLLLGSLTALLFVIIKTDALVGIAGIAPVALVLPMAMLAANDWFGRVFHTRSRLQDYLTSKTGVSQQSTTQNERLNTQVNSLQLIHFQVNESAQDSVELTLEHASLTLLTGPSGSGKSRLLQAISGLLPHRGRKLVNGVAIQSNTLVSDVAYIDQHPYCLSGTLRQNLLIARDDAKDSELTRCLSQVGLDDFSDLDEWLGEGGRILSGGELKRMGLARALLCLQSTVLIDEPFEALDAENVEVIANVLNQMKDVKKLVLASHIIPPNLRVDKQISLKEKASEVELNPSCGAR